MKIIGPRGVLHLKAKNDLIIIQTHPVESYSEAWIEDNEGNELFRGPGDVVFEWAVNYHLSTVSTTSEEEQ